MSKRAENTYISGDRLVDCQICGFTWRRSNMRIGVSITQKGFIVCPDDYDEVHPLTNRPKIRKEEGPVKIT